MRRRILACLAVLGILTPGIPAATAQAPTAAATPTPKPGEQAVTLITGDRVFVSRRDGKWHARVEPARRLTTAPGGFLQHAGPDGVTVIPVAAAPLVRAGVLDRALFDVTGLLRQGYGDARAKTLPLLVAGDNRRSAAFGVGRVTRELPDAGLTAVSAAKDRSGKTFDALTRDDGKALATGLRKVWLNGRAFPTLDVSVPQVGAPAAWQAGHTGRGARVAVLDTGYDPAHPELAGVVTGERDFVGEPSGIRDTVGHGTHVASTVAGRGTRYTGVAKDANLMIGKVCEVNGCPFDAIIAGMRWAAESGARVVNMSLGGGPTDGTDLLSTELNRITAEHGTLFVVAAGNAGRDPSARVSSPASADAALAVGSVSKQDEVSDFSSPGPRVGDFAVKPDIAAPGHQIVAARASGTLDDYAVDEHHARLSGTSMATPHVAGAAAILSAQHPEWRADQLKSVLMNAAHPVAASLYKQGAGRLDVGRAIRQHVTTSPASLSFEAVRWPHDGSSPVSRRVTYRNSGSAPLSLSLRLDVSEPGMFRIDADRITVPPGGEAAVTVTADPKAGQVGTHSGRLVATGTDGTVVQTAVGAYKEPETYEFTLRMTDRDGAPVAPERGIAGIYNLDDPEERHQVRGGETVRLRRGRHAVLAFVGTAIPGRLETSTTLAAEPEISVDRKTTVHIDARQGKPVAAAVDAKDARVAAAVTAMFLVNEKIEVNAISTQPSNVFAVPTSGSHRHFFYYDRFQLEQPLVRLRVTAPESFEVPVDWAPDAPQTIDTRTLTAIDVGHATQDEIAARDIRGKLAVFTLGTGEEEEYDARVKALGDAGATAALFRFSDPISVSATEKAPIPVAYTLAPEGSRLAKLGAATVTLAGRYASSYRYELAYPSFGRIPAKPAHRTPNHDLAAVRSSYRGLVGGGIAYVNHFPTRSGTLDMDWNLWSSVVRVPVERTEYYSPGIVWGHQVGIADDPLSPTAEHGFFSAQQTYRAGERLSRSWNKAVIGPSLAVSLTAYTTKPHLAFRDGDTVDVQVPLFSDSQGHAGLADSRYGSDKGDVSLYADGKLVGRSGLAGEGQFTVPGAAAEYRLVAEVSRDNPAWPLSTRVGAEWTFRSARADQPMPLPLLTVGFDPRLDMRNYAPAGRRFTIPVTVNRQPGSSGGASTLHSVEVSYDDGTTWQRVPVVRTGHCWSVTVTNPASGFVSLRASADDADGNTVTQTIVRAYRVR